MTLTENDKLELSQLLIGYTHCLDYRSIDSLGDFLTDDCEFVVDDPPFSMQGLTNIKETLRGTKKQSPDVRHVVTNVLIVAGREDVHVHAYLQIMNIRELKATVFARYIDECVKTVDGWKVKARRCVRG